MRIDLHTHSWASDGTQPPAEVVEHAARAGLDVIALTDHDTVAGWAEAHEAGVDWGVRVIPGIEITTHVSGCSVHLLAYLPDPRHRALHSVLEQSREGRLRRMAVMVERMAGDGYPITVEAVEAHWRPGSTLGRPHLADALIAAGVVADRAEAFDGLIANDSPYYLPTPDVPHPVEAVGLVLQAGGVPVMAHPAAAERGPVVGEEVIEAMAAAGLVGLEVHHRDHSDEARARMKALADRLGLLVTGSSDYHGAGKLNRLGENTTAPDVLQQIEALASGAACADEPSAGGSSAG